VASSAWVFASEGKFAVRGLKKGTYTLKAFRFDGGEQVGLVELEGVATGTTGVELRLTE
jgi:hypothetical protein